MKHTLDNQENLRMKNYNKKKKREKERENYREKRIPFNSKIACRATKNNPRNHFFQIKRIKSWILQEFNVTNTN